MNIQELLETRFNTIKVDKFFDEFVLNNTIIVLYSKDYNTLTIWKAHYDYTMNKWTSGFFIDEFKDFHYELCPNLWLDTLSTYIDKTEQGLLRCHKCGRWLNPDKDCWNHSGFVGVVCSNCEPEPIDTSDW